jgi:DNA polymerase-3 subunit beta
MKLRLNRQEMAESLTALCSVAAARTPKEILKCVRIEAQSDVLLLSATDLELCLRCAVTQVEVEDLGETLVVAETLAKIVRECTDELLSIETDASMLHVRGEGVHFQIVTQDAVEFPPVPVLEDEPDFTIERGLLSRLIEWTVFASARESTRYAINGVLWEVDGDGLTLAATDGRRLAVGHGKLTTTGSAPIPSVIVPSKALSVFGRLPADDDQRVGVKISGNQLLMSMGGSLIGTILVEGHFPKYQDVIPGDCDQLIKLNSSEFLAALKQAALLTNEESKGVRLSFSKGNLTLSSRAPEQGEATISMPVAYEGESLEIGFNPVFLLDVLRVVHTDEITLALKEANRPGVVRVDDDFVHVVMPVNLSSA